MPYYLHRASVTPEQLAKAIDALPGAFDSDYIRCACDMCKAGLARERERYAARLADSSDILGTFQSPGDAHKAKGDVQSEEPLSVSFVPTSTESAYWRYRERNRRNVDRLPWAGEPWQVDLNKLHHAYVSALKPGLIAYTPSEEWGCSDRQQRVRPGRYLEQFRPELTQAERDRFCAMIKALDDRNVVKFATTAEEIEAVYRRGPESCMSHDLDEYVTDVHPVTVYGDSDLQCAYLGDIAGKVTARCMVWKAEKRYGRNYGNSTLEQLLIGLGFDKGPGEGEDIEYGNFAGARVRVVEHSSDVFVMPYIDSTGYVKLTADCAWFVLGAPNESRYQGTLGETGRKFSCRETNGTTSSDARRTDGEDEVTTCANCGDEIGSDDVYCSSCDDQRRECCCCGHEFFTDDPDFVTSNDGEPVCRRCITRGRVQRCQDGHCSNLFREGDYSADETAERQQYDVTDRCLDCGETAIEESKADEAEQAAQEEAEAADEARERAESSEGLRRADGGLS